MEESSTVLSEEEVQGLRNAVQTIKRDVERIYSTMSHREKVLGVEAITRQLLEATMVRLEEEGTLEDEVTATEVRAELQRVLLRIFEKEFAINLR